ncbi:MAG: hypothetical protein R3330_13355, partial [Saprospiraceae bacterium]|nr:hypothetical protein [Saprospiraceae bacterium]
MSTPTLRKCPECGEEKPRKAFWGKNREPQEICTPCRRRIKRHARYIKAKDKQRQQEAKTALRTALRAQARVKEESLVAAAVAELDRMISRIKNRIRSHNKRIEEGRDTPRTFTGLKHQTQKLDYYLDIYDVGLPVSCGGDAPLEIGHIHSASSGLQTYVPDVAWSADGGMIAVRTSDIDTTVFATDTGYAWAELPYEGPLSFSSDGEQILTGTA